ncbi:DNA polymerase I [Terriglobus sp.]|uniref:DNA polymerase I n=1 Tax=Terriglobus sp. TaxID=1889013 RepID=UPI003B007783
MPDTTTKPPVYLLDSMAFVFRAYHAMQRSRPMSTRTGIPTAATYVFINMINKLRQDFQPKYLAAIYEGGAPVHRNERAAEMKIIQKFNIKTQQFDKVDYGGYKATRAETPDDLKQQQPYIRRALDAFHIPILNYEGYEADDVIGTLSCRLAEQGHHVYIVSSDKDMMQLVNNNVSILNPMKDNLILDPSGVEQALGVRPEQVIDVMALRGDSIDNIPGAPGIGDKGSVDLIQQFGTVEAALDTARDNPDSIKGKRQRESLANNREAVLISKELVTIHKSLPVEYTLDAMQTTEPDLAAVRALYTELEFTTLLKELPAPETAPITYNLNPTAEDIATLLTAARQQLPGTTSETSTAGDDAGSASSDTSTSAPPSPQAKPGSRVPKKSAKTTSNTTAQLSFRPEDEQLHRSSVVEKPASLFEAPQMQQEDENVNPTAANIAAATDPLFYTGLNLAGLAIFLPEDPQAIAEETTPEDADAEPEEPADLPASNLNLFGNANDGSAPPSPQARVGSEAEPFAPPTTDPLLIGLAATADTAILLDLHSDLAAPIREALADPTLPKILHDLKSVLRTLALAHLSLAGVRDDVMLYSYLINPTHLSHTLADVAARFNDRALTGTNREATSKKAKPVENPNRLPEAASAVLQLQRTLGPQVTEASLRDTYTTIDLPLVPVLLRMEQAGCQVDTALLRNQNSRLALMMDDLAKRIHEMAGVTFNINSPKQLGDVLFNTMGLPKPLKYGKGKVVSTAQDVLEELSVHHEAPRLVLEYRQLAKLRSNYTEQLPLLVDKASRVHTTFNQVATSTGRLSATNPNLQNIPVRTELGREIRAAFTARPAKYKTSDVTTDMSFRPEDEQLHRSSAAEKPASPTRARSASPSLTQDNILLAADYSQIELRLMAHFSQDPLLVHAYQNNIDIHTLTASEVFGVPEANMDKETRGRAKAVNFGIVYGISPFGLAANLGIDQKTAKTYIETYFDRYAGVRTFIERTLAETRESGKVSTLFGRTRPIPDIHSRNPNARGFAERTAVNTPLQGTAADMIKVAMLRIDARLRARNLQTEMTLQVHDELLFDAPPDEVKEVTALVKHEMESVITLSIPIVAEVGQGPNWRDAK